MQAGHCLRDQQLPEITHCFHRYICLTPNLGLRDWELENYAKYIRKTKRYAWNLECYIFLARKIGDHYPIPNSVTVKRTWRVDQKSATSVLSHRRCGLCYPAVS